VTLDGFEPGKASDEFCEEEHIDLAAAHPLHLSEIDGSHNSLGPPNAELSGKEHF
jgi:hypothetical protein